MTSRVPVLCTACSRYGGRDSCTSFPAGIPADILVLGGDHRTSLAGEPPFELDEARRDDYELWLRFSAPEA
jgi:hypothetical protein